jgi:transcriptional regulator with XRE-family HTH domain
VLQRRTDHALPLGRQLREARRCARLNAKELATKAGLSPAAVYNVERRDRGGRTRTLIKLAKALGLKLRIPDLAALASERGLTEAKLAVMASIAFDTVRSILSNPLSGNVRSFERLCEALNYSAVLVI